MPTWMAWLESSSFICNVLPNNVRPSPGDAAVLCTYDIMFFCLRQIMSNVYISVGVTLSIFVEVIYIQNNSKSAIGTLKL